MAWRAEEEKRNMSLYDASRKQLQVHEERLKIPEGWKATAIFAMTSKSAIKLFMVLVCLVARNVSNDLSDLDHVASGRYLSRCFGLAAGSRLRLGFCAVEKENRKRGPLLFVLHRYPCLTETRISGNY